MSEHVPTETTATPALKAQGWLVAITLSAIIVLVMLMMAFSTRNTPMSVDGDKAEYSDSVQSE